MLPLRRCNNYFLRAKFVMTMPDDIEKQLDEVTRRFRSLMDNCVDAMIIIDEDGTILDFNPAAEKIFQYPAADIVGRNVSQLMPEPDRSAHDGYIRNYLNSGDAKITNITDHANRLAFFFCVRICISRVCISR